MPKSTENKGAYSSPFELPRIRSLRVVMNGKNVGTLAEDNQSLIAFEYTPEWLAEGFAISPFSLPLQPGVFTPQHDPFDGLFGTFDDSLPDGWGRLLVDRFLRARGIDPFSISPLVRLAIVGQSGMGALEYEPELSIESVAEDRTLDELADDCAEMLRTDYSPDLDTLFALGGSSGGARPKILTQIDAEDWIIKFPSSYDPKDIGALEYKVARAASECGIEMPDVRLMPSNMCSGYFAIKRFDRTSRGKIHMTSAGALLETSHRIPNLDYDMLLKLTLLLTNSMSEVEKLFRLMVFNVVIGNRDDHAKNFSFLHKDDGWMLSPAYDLTQNAGTYGEHATTVNGKGKDISFDDVLAVGTRAGLSAKTARAIATNINDAAHDYLADSITLPGLE